MLPLTRNIFRQTATSFNNTTKRWKQEKPLHPDKMVKFCCLWIIEKFTLIHQQNEQRWGRNVTLPWAASFEKGWSMVRFGGHRFSTYVSPMMRCVNDKRCIWRFFFFFFLEKVFQCRFNFKAFFLLWRPGWRALTMRRDTRRAFLRGKVCTTVDSWAHLLVFVLRLWTCGRLCDGDKLDRWLMGNDSFPRTSPGPNSRSASAARFVQNNHRRKPQFQCPSNLDTNTQGTAGWEKELLRTVCGCRVHFLKKATNSVPLNTK